MKPIRLEFKGLNSYIDKQDIDFRKLTEKGLFGIFGPTGSGKSTILDALTLALYGHIPRGCKEYINSNCEDMTVIYTFELDNKIECIKYIAERCFRKKNGVINTKYVRLLENSMGEERVLAEKAKEMNDAIISLLGLTAEDFTRSVVIPQGRFSEFLKLKGADRRYMLERIFDLEQYGKGMTEKIRRHKHQCHALISRIDGGLAKYEGINSEQYDSLLAEYQITNNELQKLEDKRREYQREYDRLKRINELNNDLKQYSIEYEGLQLQTPEVEKKKEHLERLKKAGVIKPELEEEISLKTKLSLLEESLSKLESNLGVEKNLNREVKDKFLEVESIRETKTPKLKYKMNEIDRALELEENALEIKTKIDGLSNKLANDNSSKKAILEQYEDNNERLKASYEDIEAYDKRINRIAVKAEYRAEIERAAEVEKEYLLYKHEMDKLENSLVHLEQETEKTANNVNELVGKQAYLQHRINDRNNLLTQKKQEEMLFADKTQALKTKIVEYKAVAEAIEDIYKSYMLRNKQYDAGILNYSNLKQQVLDLEGKLRITQETLNKKEEQLSKREYISMVNTIKAGLGDGDECPICGSVFNNKGLPCINTDVLQLRDEIKILKEDLYQLKDEENRRKIEFSIVEKELKAIDGEANELKSKYTMLALKLDKFNYSIEESEVEKRITDFIRIQEAELSSVNKQYSDITAEIDATMELQKEELNQLNQVEKDLSTYVERLKSLKLNLDEKKTEMYNAKKSYEIKEQQYKSYNEKYNEIKDFNKEKSELAKKEQEMEQIRINIELERENNAKLYAVKEQITSKLSEIDKVINATERVLEVEVRNFENLKNEIHEICMDKSPIEYKSEIEEQINEIEESYSKLKSRLNVNEERINFLNMELTARSEEFKIIEGLIKKHTSKIENLLQRLGFENREEIDKYCFDEEQLICLDKEISLFSEALSKVKNNIARVCGLLGEDSITEEEWLEFCFDKEQNEKSYTTKIAELSALVEKKERMKKELEEVNLLRKQKEEGEHRLAMLNDIDSLISANKFVEFAARNELYYIASEASERLMDITGRYALELDENGEFIIRDDLNGGVRRDTATLSGGETFVTSLALALALSSQIQLKGNVPLEFFFLDEGFGSLDNNLINVVMESLEKLRDNKMSVGIISHVDELKSRVPVKLVTQPPRFGEYGSSVKIEYT